MAQESPTACARSNECREAIALSMFPCETRARHIRRCSFTLALYREQSANPEALLPVSPWSRHNRQDDKAEHTFGYASLFLAFIAASF